jgi:phosphate-selective porin OprO/OprP
MSIWKRWIFLATALSISNLALAEQPVEGAVQTRFFEEIWRGVEVLGDRREQDFPFVKFRGRYHGQAFTVNGDGDDEDGWEHRRFRLGMDVLFSEKLEFAFDLNMATDSEDDVVDNFDFIAINYAINPNTAISFGKLRRNPLTREDSISSNRILTIERSLLTSRYFIDNVGGIFAVHADDRWAFGGGVLLGNTEEDLALPTFDGSKLFKGNIAKQLTPITEIRLDYLHNPGDPDNNEVEPFRNVFSLSSYTRSGRWGLITDMIYAHALPEARGDLYGFVVLPHYMLTQRLQLVGRYTWSGSNEADGIRLLNRYERRAVPEGFEFGDRHQALYAGLNYYFFGHKLKLMAGLEYTDFESVNGNTTMFTANAAVRAYF